MSSEDTTRPAPGHPGRSAPADGGGPAFEGAAASLSRADIHRLASGVAGPGRRVPVPAAAAVVGTGVSLGREVGQRFAAWRRRRLGLRGVLLYLLPLPLPMASLIGLASGDAGAALSAIAAFAALIGGAYLNRRALREQLIAPERRFTRPATMPYGYLAAALVAAGTAMAAGGVVGHDTLASGLFALLAAIGFHLRYPLPPPRSLLASRAAVPGDTRVRSALETAERRLLAMELAAEGVGNLELEQRLRRIAAQGRGILEVIAARPAELSRARKFLNVYLEGAERVASRYVQTHRLSRSRALESRFRNVLAEIEAVFERQRTVLLVHDVDDLDVQIEVLRKQLEREGLA